MEQAAGNLIAAGWALRLARTDASALDPLRLWPGLDVLETGADLWLRGSNLDDLTDAAIRAVPALRRFTVLRDNQLVAAGSHVPDGSLPKGDWMPLNRWLEVVCPRALLAGVMSRQATFGLQRGGEVQEPNLLLTTGDHWLRFGRSASAIRLQPLSFAMNDQGQVLVHGRPLPPLPGVTYVLDQRVALPAGWQFTRGLQRADVANVLKLDGETIALFHADGSWTPLCESHFAAAHRSAIRLSLDPALATGAKEVANG